MASIKAPAALLICAALFFSYGSKNTDAAGTNYLEMTKQVEHNWGKGGPNGLKDHFTATFDQSQNLKAGDYFMQTLADDGVTVDVNNHRVIDRLNYSPAKINRAYLENISEGPQKIITNYKEGTGNSIVFSHVVPFDSWLGYYYANTTFSGNPVGAKIIAPKENGSLVETNWSRSPLPGKIPVDHFSAIYYTAKRLKAGDYLVRAGADDGLQVYIDGKRVLDRFKPVGYREDAVKVTVQDSAKNGDIHWIEVRYKEGILSSRLNVSFQPYSVVTDPAVEDGWTGELFNNVKLSGNPVVLGGNGAASPPINDLNFNWGTGSPSPLIPNDYYSARFTRKIKVDDPGYYYIKVTADDGVRVYIDDQLVIDSWKYQSPLERKAGVALTAGIHTVKVEYYDGKLGSKLQFELAKGKDTYQAAEKAIRYNWGKGSPDPEVQPDHFSAVFDQSQYLDTGDYFMQTLADDGLQVNFNGKSIIDRKSFSKDSMIDRVLLPNVTSGVQQITTNYYEGSSYAVLFSEIVKFGDWLAYYYPNQTLSGEPIAAKVVKASDSYGGLSENLGTGSPVPGVVGTDHFSAKYVTAKRIPAGTYVLRTGADDGIQVYLDGKLVLDRFTNGGFREDSIKLQINDLDTTENPDVHWLEVRYKEASSAGRVEAYLQPYSDAVNLTTDDGWLGEFYPNTSLTGDSVIIGGHNPLNKVNSLNFQWGNYGPTPLVPNDSFSARFTKKVKIDTTGNYAITVYADDGVRVMVDGSTKIDSWQYVSGNKRQVILKGLKAGTHTIVVEYYDGKLGASLTFDLQQVRSTSYLDFDLRKPADITAQDIIDFFNRVKPTSSFKKYAQDFIDVQRETGVNAQYLAAHAIWETGWGTSSLTVYKQNFFGYGAFNSCPFTCAYYFPTGHDTISYVAYQVKTDYLTPGSIYDNGPTLIGMNMRYASDQNWKNGIASLMQSIKPFDPVYYDKVKPNTAVPKTPPDYSREIPAGNPIPSSIIISFPSGIIASVTSPVNFRSLPYVSTATLIGSLAAGTKLDVLGYDTDVKTSWYRVKVNGKTGWVSGDYISIQNLIQVSAATSTTIYSDASSSSSTTTTVKTGAYIKVVLDTNGKKITKNGWYQVYVPGSTKTGWILGTSVKVID